MTWRDLEDPTRFIPYYGQTFSRWARLSLGSRVPVSASRRRFFWTPCPGGRLGGPLHAAERLCPQLQTAGADEADEDQGINWGIPLGPVGPYLVTIVVGLRSPIAELCQGPIFFSPAWRMRGRC